MGLYAIERNISISTLVKCDRKSYIREMEKALDLLDSKHEKSPVHLLVELTTDEEHPLMVDELHPLSDFFSNLSSDLEFRWGLGMDRTLGEEMKICLIAGFK